MSFDIRKCGLCPRKCGADRTKKAGFCGGGEKVKIARAALHYWEEPCISGEKGSGTVFFSGCPLKCCFCQNFDISAENFGREISTERLGKIFLELQEKGAHNINLVNPTHYVPWIIEALDLVREKLKIPVVYNSGGYETEETLRMIDGYVDIYLPDMKYMSNEISAKYSGAGDYFQIASKALKIMLEQVGKPVFGDDGMLRKGVIVRHLTLPNCRRDSIAVVKWLEENFSPDEILISLMSQYTPFYNSKNFPEINRRISTFEYNAVLSAVEQTGFKGFMQEKSSAKEEYTPVFDLEGV